MTLADYEVLEAPAPYRWTVEDFFRASELGLFEGQHVQLIEGEIIDMPAQKDPHAWTVSQLVDVLRDFFPKPHWIKIQATLVLGEYSAPEPDVSLLSGPPCPPAVVAPETLLVIEVSETTLRYDRGRKASLYASKQILDYWVVDVLGKQVEVFRDPVPDKSQKYGWRYNSVKPFGLQEQVTPLVSPDISIPIASFLG
jgi:Uma2 family endonuclease